MYKEEKEFETRRQRRRIEEVKIPTSTLHSSELTRPTQHDYKLPLSELSLLLPNLEPYLPLTPSTTPLTTLSLLSTTSLAPSLTAPPTTTPLSTTTSIPRYMPLGPSIKTESKSQALLLEKFYSLPKALQKYIIEYAPRYFTPINKEEAVLSKQLWNKTCGAPGNVPRLRTRKSSFGFICDQHPSIPPQFTNGPLSLPCCAPLKLQFESDWQQLFKFLNSLESKNKSGLSESGTEMLLLHNKNNTVEFYPNNEIGYKSLVNNYYKHFNDSPLKIFPYSGLEIGGIIYYSVNPITNILEIDYNNELFSPYNRLENLITSDYENSDIKDDADNILLQIGNSINIPLSNISQLALLARRYERDYVEERLWEIYNIERARISVK